MLARANTQRARRAATTREAGQGREGFADAAVVADEVMEGPRADIVAPNEAQPVEPLLVVHSRPRFHLGTRFTPTAGRTTTDFA